MTPPLRHRRRLNNSAHDIGTSICAADRRLIVTGTTTCPSRSRIGRALVAAPFGLHDVGLGLGGG